MFNADEVLRRNVEALTATSDMEQKMTPPGRAPLPSIQALREIIDMVKTVIFPEFYDRRRNCRSIRSAVIAINLEKIYSKLTREVINGFQFDPRTTCDDAQTVGSALSLRFIDMLPEIKRLLYTDVQAMYDNDPAVDDYGEIILSYPVVQAMVNYRTAHALLDLGVPALPRIITELAHSETGIDINPGAVIGEYFAIDHGSGVVIGQTSIIGNHVTLYQGVTLGAKNFTLDDNGHPVNVPRHPIIEDNVTIYSGASILGRITVGHDSVVGGNVWLTHSVPPYSRILQPEALTSTRNLQMTPQ
ncbi:MAG: serine acetyltransferase [Lachnoclostridium sp.]|nr:serine acetyltransferase [Lachnoclostridium sp.]